MKKIISAYTLFFYEIKLLCHTINYVIVNGSLPKLIARLRQKSKRLWLSHQTKNPRKISCKKLQTKPHRAARPSGYFATF